MDDLEKQSLARLAAIDHFDRDQKIAALGQRFDLFAAACLRIRTKEGGPMLSFAINPIQEDFLRILRKHYRVTPDIDNFRGIRTAIVKPRQLGFSTLIAGLFFHDAIKNPGRVTVVLTHHQTISEELLRTYRGYWDKLPEGFKTELKLSTASKYELEIQFPEDHVTGERPTPSRIVIWTEAGQPWRGGVIHNLHASEAAWYKDFPSFKASFLQAVPQDGNVHLETTANGQNAYYEEVISALEGRAPWRVVYYPWYAHPEYRRPWMEHFDRLTPEELSLMAEHGLDNEQIAWRRWKQGELGDLFPQEYPESLLGAFLSTGRPFFDPYAVNAAVEIARKMPMPRTPTNYLRVWEDPVPGETYVLCADVAEGIDRGSTDPTDPERGGSDFSAGYVIKARNLQVVAAIHGRIPPTDYARLLERVGRMYRATIAPERNNHGHTIVHALEMAFYPELYRHLEYDQGGASFLKAGFPTDGKTRPMMLDALGDVIRSGALVCPDDRFWLEAATFHRNAKGRPEALANRHDDRVMALAIGVYLCTLGRSGWGIGTEGKAWAGMPTAAVGPLALPAPPPAPEHVKPAEEKNIWDTVVEQKAAARATSCGGCISFVDGRCKQYGFIVGAPDPGCPAHYPASLALDESASGWD